ncbi:putative NAD(P)H nitroreductase [Mycobacterium tuberculosis]|uniref:Putative NAD(P)H nitroreductase n=1 Tax=Mycobacterium tuberculosis TaxID=1773 RepID=A0A655ASB0_MYCTX|nr:putative NAD(P)H nitroreductase [Mycobacterium tuberculosis]
MFGAGGYPQMLLRVGWAPINADPLSQHCSARARYAREGEFAAGLLCPLPQVR